MRRQGGRWLAGALLVAACSASSPDVPTPPDEIRADGGTGTAFADTLIAYSEGSQLLTCVGTLAACGDGEPTSDCEENAAVGAQDGATHALEAGARLEVAFRCGLVLEAGSSDGTASPDLKIWSTVPEGGRTVVEVSFDGSTYEQLDLLDQSDDELELERIGWDVVRFVRLVNNGTATIEVDAVEALHSDGT